MEQRYSLRNYNNRYTFDRRVCEDYIFTVGPNRDYPTIAAALAKAYTVVVAGETIVLDLEAGQAFTMTATPFPNTYNLIIQCNQITNLDASLGPTTLTFDSSTVTSTVLATPRYLSLDGLVLTGDLTLTWGWNLLMQDCIGTSFDLELDNTDYEDPTPYGIRVRADNFLSELNLSTVVANGAVLLDLISFINSNFLFSFSSQCGSSLSFEQSNLEFSCSSTTPGINSTAAGISIFSLIDTSVRVLPLEDASNLTSALGAVSFAPVSPIDCRFIKTGSETWNFGASLSFTTPFTFENVSTLPLDIGTLPPEGTILNDNYGADGGTQITYIKRYWDGDKWSLGQDFPILASTNISGAWTIDLDAGEVQIFTITGDVTSVSTTGRGNLSKSVSILILSDDGGDHNIDFTSGGASSWQWVGLAPVDVADTTHGMLALTTFGSGEADVVAAYEVLGDGT